MKPYWPPPMPRLPFLVAPVLTGFLLLCITPSAHAARLLRYTIEVNGTTLFTAIFADEGLSKPAEVWSYLQLISFTPDPTARYAVDDTRPMQVKLAGNIIIRASHTNRSIAEAKLTELTLTQGDAKWNEWKLNMEEIVRSASVAGLGILPPIAGLSTTQWYWYLGGIVLIVGVVLLVSKLLGNSATASPRLA